MLKYHCWKAKFNQSCTGAPHKSISWSWQLLCLPFFFFFSFFFFFFMKWHLFSSCIHMNWVKWIRPFSSLVVNRVTNKRWKGRKSRKLIQPMMELKKIYPVINKLVPLRFLPNYKFSIFFLGKKKTWDKTNSELN